MRTQSEDIVRGSLPTHPSLSYLSCQNPMASTRRGLIPYFSLPQAAPPLPVHTHPSLTYLSCQKPMASTRRGLMPYFALPHTPMPGPNTTTVRLALTACRRLNLKARWSR